jgi:hypothetical protein
MRTTALRPATAASGASFASAPRRLNSPLAAFEAIWIVEPLD